MESATIIIIASIVVIALVALGFFSAKNRRR